MSDINPTHEGVIDWIRFVQILSDGKWKILFTAFIGLVVGVAFVTAKQNIFKVSTPIHSGDESAFITYTPLNEILKESEIPFHVDNKVIFEMFIDEFADYEEMIDSVRSSSYVQKAIKNLDEQNKPEKLAEFAKLFELREPTKNNNNWALVIKWYDADEALLLIEDGIKKTLENVKLSLHEKLDYSATVVESRNAFRLQVLENKLEIADVTQGLANAKRVRFLEEHSTIAKALGLRKNMLDPKIFQSKIVVSGASQKGDESLTEPIIDDVPYYLRGYLAIDEEIALIRDRSSEQNRLFGAEYLATEQEIISIKKNIKPALIKSASAILTADDTKNWLRFNLRIADFESAKNWILYTIIPLILGGIFGAMYVFYQNALRDHLNGRAGT